MNTNSFFYKDLEISHVLKRSLKHSYININADAKIILRTPSLSKKTLLGIVENKELWIRKKIEEVKRSPVPQINLKYELLLFGEIYKIDSLEAKDLEARLSRIKNSSTQNILKCYDLFYKDLSKVYIPSRLKYFSALMGLEYLDVKFRKMKRRWGSCNSKKTLTFNIELMKIDKELIDYVIVHELAHLKYMNHSRDFHALVESYFPQAKECVKKLKNTKIHSF